MMRAPFRLDTGLPQGWGLIAKPFDLEELAARAGQLLGL